MGKHGGIRPGQGRKSKAEEQGLIAKLRGILSEEDEKQIWLKIIDQAKKGSKDHQQIIMNRLYGKPTEHKKIENDFEGVVILRKNAD